MTLAMEAFLSAPNREKPPNPSRQVCCRFAIMRFVD